MLTTSSGERVIDALPTPCGRLTVSRSAQRTQQDLTMGSRLPSAALGCEMARALALSVARIAVEGGGARTNPLASPER